MTIEKKENSVWPGFPKNNPSVTDTVYHSNLIVLTESFKFLFKFFLSFYFLPKKIFLQGI